MNNKIIREFYVIFRFQSRVKNVFRKQYFLVFVFFGFFYRLCELRVSLSLILRYSPSSSHLHIKYFTKYFLQFEHFGNKPSTHFKCTILQVPYTQDTRYYSNIYPGPTVTNQLVLFEFVQLLLQYYTWSILPREKFETTLLSLSPQTKYLTADVPYPHSTNPVFQVDRKGYIIIKMFHW